MCWHGYRSGARCRLAYGPADATASHCLLLGCTFLVPAHPGSPGKRAIKCVCVCFVRMLENDIGNYLFALHKCCDVFLTYFVTWALLVTLDPHVAMTVGSVFSGSST